MKINFIINNLIHKLHIQKLKKINYINYILVLIIANLNNELITFIYNMWIIVIAYANLIESI